MSTPIMAQDFVPAGTNVVAAWPLYTVLPSQDKLREIASELGQPFEVSYLDIYIDDASHQGVTLAQARWGYEISAHFAQYTGNAPMLVAVDADLGEYIETEKKGEAAKEIIKDTIEDLGLGSLEVTHTVGNLPQILLVGGLIVGGILVVGAGIYFWSRRKKK